MRRVSTASLCLAAILWAMSPAAAQKLAADEPFLEVGVDVGLGGPDGSTDRARRLVAPNVTMNLTPRTALVVSADVFSSRQDFAGSWDRSRVATVEIRRALLRSDRVELNGIVGGGYGRTRRFEPEYRFGEGQRQIIVPARDYSESGGEMTFGAGLEERIAPRLALRQELRVVLGEVSEVRAQAGVVVPVGRYAPRFDAVRARRGGRPDTLKNGTIIGTVIGAATMAGFVGWLARALCEGDCDDFGSAIALGAAYGGGVGALAGAMVDSVVE